MLSAVGETFEVRPGVAEALAAGRPVVALESTVVAHGLPRPSNLEAAMAMEERIRREGGEPATIGVIGSRVVVGLSASEIRELATRDGVAKVSRPDLAAVVSSGAVGATTVAATAWAAGRAGIRLMATGGIGGAHRPAAAGGPPSWDVSTDLPELARTPVAVVCSGAKVILDLERTLEQLETYGVPVVGIGTNEFPAFYARRSGFELTHSVAGPAEAARLLAAHWELGAGSGVVLAQPPPEAVAMELEEVERLVERAVEEAGERGVRGKALTPFLLARMAELSEGETLRVNRALLEANAGLATRIAKAWRD